MFCCTHQMPHTVFNGCGCCLVSHPQLNGSQDKMHHDLGGLPPLLKRITLGDMDEYHPICNFIPQ